MGYVTKTDCVQKGNIFRLSQRLRSFEDSPRYASENLLMIAALLRSTAWKKSISNSLAIAIQEKYFIKTARDVIWLFHWNYPTV